MLKHRLITGPILVAVLLGVVVLDNWVETVALTGFWQDLFLGKEYAPPGLVLFLLALLTVYSWSSGSIDIVGLFSERRMANLERFLTKDIVPYPLRNADAIDRVVFELGFGEQLSYAGIAAKALFTWWHEVMLERGYEAALATVAISVLAIVLAAILSWCFAPLAASNVSTRRPFDAAALRPAQ